MTTSLATTRWAVAPRQLEAENKLRQELGIGALAAIALVRLGYTEPELAHKFLHPKLEDLHSPRLLPDFEPAIAALMRSREQKHKVYIHGDYDVDGVTSAALLTRFLRKLGFEVKTHVPHRTREGYGIRQTAVEEARAFGAQLFLTCDCGGSALDEIKQARALGMTVVVTDHHHVGDVHPDAHAFVNPHRRDSIYPFPNLCGAGVAFKLCQGLVEELGLSVSSFQNAYLDLVSLGTISDVMPLVDENRIIVRHGIPLVGSSKKPGIKALIRAAGLYEKATTTGLDAYSLSHGLGPRLNAAGRIDDAALALRLLLCDNDEEAMVYADEIEAMNQERRAQQELMVEEAIQMIHATGQADAPIILIGKEGWHPGIVGIVAGKIKDEFYRPVFVLNFDPVENVYKGSGRSIPSFHLAEVIGVNGDLVSGGGHGKAAGMSFAASDFEQVRERFLAFAQERIRPEDLVPTLELTAEVELSEIDMKAVEELEWLGPFGEANREPVFATRGLILESIRPTRNPDHPFLVLRGPDGPPLTFKAFRMGKRVQDTYAGQRLDVAFTASIDNWKGSRSIGWTVKDFQPSA